MVTLSELQAYLDKELRIHYIDDACVNGVEVGGKDNIEKVVFMVDASEQGFAQAVEHNADMIIVHHGLFFGSVKHITGNLYKRLKLLFEYNISLYAAHLPLDVHPVWGNNAQIAKTLSLKNVQPHNVERYENLLLIGELDNSMDYDQFLDIVCCKINPDSRYLSFGPKRVKKIGIISGSGADAVEIASQSGADVFITGESKLSSYHASMETGINIVFAGHYYTEVFGLKALMDVIDNKFEVKTAFIDIPTQL